MNTPDPEWLETALGPRRLLIWQRKKEGLSFQKIGDELSLSGARVGALHKQAVEIVKRGPHWTDGLSAYPSNALQSYGFESREEVLSAFLEGSLKPTLRADIIKYGHGVRCLGTKGLEEVRVWLGLPESPRKVKAHNDTQRLDWLASQTGIALVHDDFNHWAVSGCGFQNVPENPDEPNDIQTTFFIEKDEWKPSIREAIDTAMKAAQEPPEPSA